MLPLVYVTRSQGTDREGGLKNAFFFHYSYCSERDESDMRISFFFFFFLTGSACMISLFFFFFYVFNCFIFFVRSFSSYLILCSNLTVVCCSCRITLLLLLLLLLIRDPFYSSLCFPILLAMPVLLIIHPLSPPSSPA